MSSQRKSDEVLDRISYLSERLSHCEKHGKLLEAEKLSKEVAQLLSSYSKIANREVRQQQRSKQAEIESRYERTADKLAEKWDARLSHYQATCAQQEDDMIQNQEREMQILQQQMSQLPPTPKPSAEWLQMNKIKQHLMKNKAYTELHFTIKKLQEIEEREQGQYNQTRKKKIYAQIEALQTKQKREHENRVKRMKSGFDELIRQRDKDFDQLHRRYANGQNEMKIQQGHERNYVQRQSVRLCTPSKTVRQAIARHFKSAS